MIKRPEAFKGLFKSEFSKNVLTLISGVALAQIIPFLISPLLSRLYSVEDFGEFAIYNSFIGVLIILSTARFEYAIALPKENISAFRIVKLILLITICTSFLTFILFLLFRNQVSQLIHGKNISDLLILIPTSLLFISLFQSLTFWYNRRKNYKLQAISKLSSSIGQTSVSLFLGIGKVGSIGLILSYIVGQVVGLIPLISKLEKKEFSIFKRLEIDEMVVLAKRYKKFPTYMTIGSLINSFSTQLPILMITGFYSTKIVGAMSFAQIIIVVPTGLISTAFADVLRQHAVDDFASSGSCRPLLISTLKKLFFIGVIPFSLLFFTAPPLFSFLFGKQWELAGEFAQIMTFMYFVRFVFMSASGTIIIVSEKLEFDIFWQTGYFLSTFLAIYIGYNFLGDIKKVLLLMTIVSSVFYFILFLMAYNFSIKK
jgi:O-antigen/teichoic acid export membrane protein